MHTIQIGSLLFSTTFKTVFTMNNTQIMNQNDQALNPKEQKK